jgi:peptide/nickel transport system permease protein
MPMYRYFLKRILLLVPVLIGVTFIIFALMDIAPGDPGRAILGATATQDAVIQFNEKIGYYDPYFVRYGRFILGILKLDFGTSYSSGGKVLDEIVSRFPTTIKIASFSMLFAVFVGVPLGILSAVKQYSAMDNISRVMSITLAAIPFFWLGLMMIYWFSLKLGWLPSYGVSTWKHFIMPTVALGIPYAARQLRMTRSCMLETIRMDYIRTARAKGAEEKKIVLRHAFKNALMPIITMIGMQFGGLLGGAIVTESVFSMPGLGTYLVTAIRAKDVPAVLGTAVVLAVMFCFVMLIVDFFYAVIDPRIKAKYSR